MGGLSKREFEEIEGVFHDGLGSYAELCIANEIIDISGVKREVFDTSNEMRKMKSAIASLPQGHPSREIYSTEIKNIETGAREASGQVLQKEAVNNVIKVNHVAQEYKGARAGDVQVISEGNSSVPISVKTDKSGKVAIADGQTRDIFGKWASRFFRVTEEEFIGMIRELGFGSIEEIKKSEYLNVAELVVTVMIRKLELTNCVKTDLSKARCNDLDAVKYVLRQLLEHKKGSDGSMVVIIDRSTGEVVWDTILDAVSIESLLLPDISFRPSRPRDKRIGSEFAIKVFGKAVVTFQVKHKRGRYHGTAQEKEFGDITTRLCR